MLYTRRNGAEYNDEVIKVNQKGQKDRKEGEQ